ncbi:MAG TPA: L-lactate permease [Vicinamibacterales bacterium]|jgi:lactate permease|nr:L-lactate permease [Vicinamibacterales bacterium]
MFSQTLVPLGSLWITVAVAFVPLFVLLTLLAGFRLTAWLATLIAGAVTVALGMLVWHAPADLLARAYLYGGLQGVWAVDWITFWGLMIFNTLVLTGDFDRFKEWLIHHATRDIRIQTLMLAWAFGALLEGLVGFGYPWAVIAPILVGLGVADLDAIRVAALANNAPVSYGALGSPIIALAAVTGLPLMALSASVGHIVAVLALLPPWVLLYLVSGAEGVREGWPLAVVGSLSYIAGQWPVATYLGPYLPDITGALVSFWVLFAFTKMWRPATIRGFGGVPLPRSLGAQAAADALPPSPGSALRAWIPYVVLIAVVVSWTGPWSHLPDVSLVKLSVQRLSSITQKAEASTFNLNPFSPGTAILASWLIILALFRPGFAIVRQVMARTWHQIWGALLVGFFIFGLAFAFVFSGMANSMAYGCSKVGLAFVVLAPILGWVGVALSGSNTSTNAMFGPVQAVTGRLLNLPPMLLPSFNSVGAEVGKPIAPQTASVGVSTSRFVRSEGDVIRHNMAWTLVVLAYLIVIAMAFAWLAPGLMALP